ncbi:hypothetical protein MC7420_5935 [Coleofasciculus chthonoplastes PCC 7420]|uniref:Uncharacterized protein n=1 Tax=Coleofasciculus chthonoplastes PCC 7420 TaxID=118168 RepID=B4VVZ0_9CYAN|nr:hypothetical protein MC7420_5935 [Coleofasciculus chthonoplastes PCC 7420]
MGCGENIRETRLNNISPKLSRQTKFELTVECGESLTGNGK